MSLDYTQYGGVLITPDHPRAALLIGDPTITEPIWNFGRIAPSEIAKLGPGFAANLSLASQPSFYEQAPHLKGIGEGQRFLLTDICKKILKKFLNSQFQPRGTCVSRGAKRAADHCQVLTIHLGEPRKFDYISHAFIYGSCREIGGWLSYQDGAVGEWAARAVKERGNLLNVDINDDDNKDDIAVEWGARGVPADIKAKAKQLGHFVREIVPIRSWQEARDFLCAGLGAITVASNVGYQGERDSRGVVRRRGNWSHQMMFSGYRPDLAANGAFLQEQSWGPDQPGGPIGDIEIPSYAWWALAEDAAVQIRENDCFGFKMIDGWDSGVLSWRP